jgi:hypothetical protein
MLGRFTLGFTVTALAAGLLTATATMSNDCTCHKPEKGDTTRYGGNMMIVFPMEKPFRELRGTVQMNGELIENALVEIFDNADYLLESGPHEYLQQKRLAACVTSSDGKFCFRHLPSGTYELRSSMRAGVNVTHLHVKVDKRSGADKKIIVKMENGA